MVGQPLLSVEDLKVTLTTGRGPVPILNGVSFPVDAGEIVGIVGESGCGKTMTALAIMGLLPGPGGVITHGRILYRGEDLSKAGEKRLRALRGAAIAMIFQDPAASLNPVFTIGEQIAETLRRHEGLSQADARRRAKNLLDAVRMPASASRLDHYPHELSGGMCQRVMIAIAIACGPDFLIADEPTAALDVTVQAEIFDLLQEIGRERKMGMILIDHDIGVIAERADRVSVMYAGHVVESGDVRKVLTSPAHPYTQGLIACRPRMTDMIADHPTPLAEIEGVVPAPSDRPPGCPFAPRCPRRIPICETTMPTPAEASDTNPSGHIATCHHLTKSPKAAQASRPRGRRPHRC